MSGETPILAAIYTRCPVRASSYDETPPKIAQRNFRHSKQQCRCLIHRKSQMTLCTRRIKLPARSRYSFKTKAYEPAGSVPSNWRCADVVIISVKKKTGCSKVMNRDLQTLQLWRLTHKSHIARQYSTSGRGDVPHAKGDKWGQMANREHNHSS